jgi:Tfp pilus assembly protein PilX
MLNDACPTARPSPIHPGASPLAQRGIALAIALVLLVVIGLGSVVAMKTGMFSTMISGNLRSNQMAVQAAESALRFCERAAMLVPPAVPVQPLPLVNTDRPTAWQTVANWSAGAGMAVTLPAAVTDSANGGLQYAQRPQCMVETMELRLVRGAIDEEAYLVTARGFSPNYRTDAQGAINGAEVWLQSTIRFTP